MTNRDLVTDLTALLLPLPRRHDLSTGDRDDVHDTSDEIDEEVLSAMSDQIYDERADLEQQLRLAWDEGGYDPLLASIKQARNEMLDAEQRMRLLIAYAREFVGPRPYTLDDLARSAGMSISGVRTAYDDDEIADVAARTGARPRRRADTPTPGPSAGPGRR